MARKSRPTAVDKFIPGMSKESFTEFDRLSKLPSITGGELYEYLVKVGFQGSLPSVYNYLSHQRKEGVIAKQINDSINSYEGIGTERVLEKLTGVLAVQLDKAITVLEQETMTPKDYLGILPGLAREVRGSVLTMNQLKYNKERKELELAGVLYASQQLKEIFKDQPFLPAIDEAMAGIISDIQNRE